MRRRRRTVLNSNNLLLDTLCNTLGGVIFIALLVSLLAFQAPILEPDTRDVSPTEAATAFKELHHELSQLPSRTALQRQQQQVAAAIAEFEQRDIPPLPTHQSIEELLEEREQLLTELEPYHVDTTEAQPFFVGNKTRKRGVKYHEGKGSYCVFLVDGKIAHGNASLFFPGGTLDSTRVYSALKPPQVAMAELKRNPMHANADLWIEVHENSLALLNSLRTQLLNLTSLPTVWVPYTGVSETVQGKFITYEN